ncbi:MAG: ankyrin repeat domain-containing protein [Burkholderiales bacterium]
MSAFAQSLGELLQAVEKDDTRRVEVWLGKGLEVNSTDSAGNTILMLATRFGHRDMVRLLLARKADVRRRSPAGDTALMMASLNGDVRIMEDLVQAGAEINQEGWTPLHYAAFEGKADAARYLLAKGADKDAVAPNGYTPLMIAARNGKADVAKLLLYEDPDVNFRTDNGITALRIANERGMAELAELLRRAGAVE